MAVAVSGRVPTEDGVDVQLACELNDTGADADTILLGVSAGVTD